MVNEAFLGWKREVKMLRCSCVSCPVLGLTGATLDPKAAGERAYPQRNAGPLLLVLSEEAEQIFS